MDLPDERLAKLSQFFEPKKTIPAAVEFVDIAGLVKGASKGEGLGNQFLSHIREVGVIAHVVRCFDNPDIVHVNNKVDPASDIETINIELALADLASLEKRAERADKATRMGKDMQKEAAIAMSAIAKIKPLLQDGKGARNADLTDEERAVMYDTHLITMKPQLYVCNVDEDGIKNGNAYIETVKKIAAQEGAETVVICGKFEAELADIGQSMQEIPHPRRPALFTLTLNEGSLKRKSTVLTTSLNTALNKKLKKPVAIAKKARNTLCRMGMLCSSNSTSSTPFENMWTSALSLNKKQSSTYNKYACGCFLYALSIYPHLFKRLTEGVLPKGLF